MRRFRPKSPPKGYEPIGIVQKSSGRQFEVQLAGRPTVYEVLFTSRQLLKRGKDGERLVHTSKRLVLITNHELVEEIVEAAQEFLAQQEAERAAAEKTNAEAEAAWGGFPADPAAGEGSNVGASELGDEPRTSEGPATDAREAADPAAGEVANA